MDSSTRTLQEPCARRAVIPIVPTCSRVSDPTPRSGRSNAAVHGRGQALAPQSQGLLVRCEVASQGARAGLAWLCGRLSVPTAARGDVQLAFSLQSSSPRPYARSGCASVIDRTWPGGSKRRARLGTQGATVETPPWPERATSGHPRACGRSCGSSFGRRARRPGPGSSGDSDRARPTRSDSGVSGEPRRPRGRGRSLVRPWRHM